MNIQYISHESNSFSYRKRIDSKAQIKYKNDISLKAHF